MALQNWFGEGKRLRYLCQDETRVGLKSETGRVITSCGVKPVATVQWQRDNYWIYGVVEPLLRVNYFDRWRQLQLSGLSSCRLVYVNYKLCDQTCI